MKRLCLLGYLEVCLGAEPDGRPCVLCERKHQREYLRSVAREASRG